MSEALDASVPFESASLLAVPSDGIFDKDDFYNPAPLFDAVSQRFVERQSRNQAGELFAAQLFVSLRDEINAYACKWQDGHYIGITYKQTAFSRFVAQSALFWPTVFFDIRAKISEDEEHARLLKMRTQAQDIKQISSLMSEFDKAYQSKDLLPLLDLFESHDRQRRLASWYISQSIILLAFRHELAHAVNGHCAFAHALEGRDKFCLFNEVTPFRSSLDVDTVLGLELEADFYAGALAAYDLTQGLDPLDKIIRTSFDIETRMALLTFAMCSLAVAWHSETKKGVEDPVHPHPLTRAYTFLNGVYAIADEFEDVKESINRGVKRGLQSVFFYSEINPDYKDVGRIVDERTFRKNYKDITVRDLELVRPYAYWDRSYPP